MLAGHDDTRRWRRESAGGHVFKHRRLGVGIVLDIFQARGHVHDLAHGRVGIGGIREFRHVLCYERGGVDLAFGREHRRQRADERFRDRKREVLLFRRQLAEVTLVDDTAAMHDDDAIRPGFCERFGPRARLAIHVRVRHRIEVLFGARKFVSLACAPRHFCGRQELAHVTERPARVRKFQVGGVGPACELVGRRREPRHDSCHFRITGCRIGKAREVDRARRRARPERDCASARKRTDS